MTILFTLIIAYLLGSIPSALIVGKAFDGVDIRNYGSGNLGATNAFRVLGKKEGIIVIAADILKGMLAAYIGVKTGGLNIALFSGVFAIFGHSFPLFAGFKGGKGIATGAGVYFVLMPIPLIIAVLTFLAVLFITRYVSLSSILAAIILLIFGFIFNDIVLINLVTILVCIFVIYRHRSNIVKLIKGTENKTPFGLWKK